MDPDALVTLHLYLVQHVVNSLASSYPRHVDRAELWSAGALGLVDASRRFDPALGIPFVRYASIRIRGAMVDSARSRDWGSRGLRRSMRGVRDASEGFEEAQGRPPTAAELAALLGMSEEQLAERRAAAAAASLLHLDQPLGGDDAALVDGLEERCAEWLPDDAVEQRELVGSLRTAVRFLPEVQRTVIERSYFGGELLRDIATSLGVTEARVSQIRTEALVALRSWFGTAYEGVPTVPERAPGGRQRAAYVATLSAQSTWRSRLRAADERLASQAS